jgi:hypothetical protein
VCVKVNIHTDIHIGRTDGWNTFIFYLFIYFVGGFFVVVVVVVVVLVWFGFSR